MDLIIRTVAYMYFDQIDLYSIQYKRIGLLDPDRLQYSRKIESRLWGFSNLALRVVLSRC